MLSIEQAKEICRIEHQKELVKNLNDFEWQKYLEEDHFIDEKIKIFEILGLDKTSHQRVLDVGAGLGHFGALCKHYGHTYLGTYFGRTSEKLHPLFVDADLPHVECGLFPRRGKEIPLGPWDRIVMIRTTFELNAEWIEDDWQELVQVCMDQLTPGGQLLIKSNLSVELKSKYGALETQCQQRMMKAFSDKLPLPFWQWATWHWIKE